MCKVKGKNRIFVFVLDCFTFFIHINMDAEDEQSNYINKNLMKHVSLFVCQRS